MMHETADHGSRFLLVNVANLHEVLEQTFMGTLSPSLESPDWVDSCRNYWISWSKFYVPFYLH